MRNTFRLFLPLLLLALLVAACGGTATNGAQNQPDMGLGIDETPMVEEPGVGEPLTGNEDLEPGVTEPLPPPAEPGVGEPMTGTEEMDTGMAGEVEVNIADFNYDPQDLTVQVGDTVTWTNNDDVAHTVTAGTPDSPMGEFDSGELQPGDTFSYTFDQAGTFDYFCTLHPDMTASVTVEEATQ